MARRCTVCVRAEASEINRSLVAGAAIRDIAGRFGLSKSSVERHRCNCLPESLARAHDAQEVADADDLLSQVRDLQRKALSILEKAEKGGDLKTALQAIREARGNLELLAKLLGELDERPTVNVLLTPEWVNIRAVIVAALLVYPEARASVAQALLQLEAPNGRGV